MRAKTNYWAVAIFCTTALLVQPALARVPTVEKVTGGRIEGTVSRGVTVFKGIPYAAPPVGRLRWRGPQPVIPWSGIKKTVAFAPACMQPASPGNHFNVPPSENCLYLNIWTPAKSTSAKLPVMVWIYGGGFVGGATNLTDGMQFAKNGVVLVTISYRTGIFGFFATPALTREAGHGSGNQGLQDQIAALRWVKSNITKFGGNSNNVTIFGESAGAISTSMLAASPLAKGLFEKVISQSGGYFSPPRQFPHEGGALGLPLAKAEQKGKTFLTQLGVHTLKAARALPAAKIEAAFEAKAFPAAKAGNYGALPWPDFDGYVLKGDSYTRYQEGEFNDTPILIGTNVQGGQTFVKSVTSAAWTRKIHREYGDKASLILAAYPHATSAQALQSARELFADVYFKWPTYAWANLETTQGKHKAYVYSFLRKTKKYPQGAIHGADLLPLWGYGSGPHAEQMTAELSAMFGTNPNDKALGRQMRQYWTNFARTGNPNGPGLPHWPTYSVNSPEVLQLAPAKVVSYPHLVRLKVLGNYYNWRREQLRGIPQKGLKQ